MPVYPLHEVTVDLKSDGKSTFRVPTHLEFIKKVGSGAYGCVASFKDTRNSDKVAVKKITKAFDDLVDGKRILREVRLLRHFDHDNIIRILDMFPPEGPDFEDIYIVTDLMETDLHRVIYSKQPLTEEHAQYFVHQVLRGLLYLHTANVVHRDLKPANLLVNKNCDLKICDFGLARSLALDRADETLNLTDYVVTRWYRAPEVVLLASEYTESVDVWAIGCILCELIGRQPIFAGKDHLDQIKKIVAICGSPSEEELVWLPRNGSARAFLKKCPVAPKADWATIYSTASKEALDGIAAMLKFNPSERCSCANALRLKYFDSLFEEEDMEVDTRVSPVNWAFDHFDPTKRKLQNFIYSECARFHPEVVARDKDKLDAKGITPEVLASSRLVMPRSPTQVLKGAK